MYELRVIKLANLHPRMERNILVSWLKHGGDPVRKGEPLYLMETRKGVFEVCSEFGGSVDRLLVPEGAAVAVDQGIAFVRLIPDEEDRHASRE